MSFLVGKKFSNSATFGALFTRVTFGALFTLFSEHYLPHFRARRIAQTCPPQALGDYSEVKKYATEQFEQARIFARSGKRLHSETMMQALLKRTGLQSKLKRASYCLTLLHLKKDDFLNNLNCPMLSNAERETAAESVVRTWAGENNLLISFAGWGGGGDFFPQKNGFRNKFLSAEIVFQSSYHST